MRAETQLPLSAVDWSGAVRIIRTNFPPIDLFEDIADPADWPLIISAEQKTNPRLVESIGNLDMVPRDRRVSGPGASYLMAPFTHASPHRPSRFSDGSFGVMYVGIDFETALFETMHHHAEFMARTAEAPGWTSQFREIIMDVAATLHDLRHANTDNSIFLDPDNYTQAQLLGQQLHEAGANGLIYPSVRYPTGQCVGLFYPDLAATPTQGRHLDYHWNGTRVDFYRNPANGQVFEVMV